MPNLYRDVLSAVERDHLVENLAAHLGDGVTSEVRDRAVALLRKVDAELGARVAAGPGIGESVRAAS